MNKNVPERGMSKQRWEELRGTTNGGMGRTLRSREKLVHMSQWYRAVTRPVLDDNGNHVGDKFVKWEEAHRIGNKPSGFTLRKTSNTAQE